ncbi:hypothetical protein BJQ94_19230 [Cryobacterium sp. SO2]|uniref:hypothetical protein n=1 Tax=Cryobacterium sp. SO2 TaxID=1897060 RepID=UPI00223D61C6|nr:hypothetical protein [Cryobacterium sp. SO2]WEO77455.1 hypothetical protein BJQ94_19230 [Cryobacterium sp. SO2]
MDPWDGNFPSDGEAAAVALARLREQRWLLGLVRDEVEATGRRIAGQGTGAGWRSTAQRAYADSLAGLAGDLQTAWRALEDALSAVDRDIEQVKVAR